MYRLFISAIFLFISFSSLADQPEVKEMENLPVGEVGSFGELSLKPNPDNLVLVYIPGIEALLERARQLKGSELSPKEEEKIRAAATVMASPADVANKTIEQRGYE